MTLKKRYSDIKDAHAALDKLSKNKALYRPHLGEILKLKKYYFHSLIGLEKQLKKELGKIKNIDIDKIALELMAEVPFNGEVALYNDGSIAYLSQGGMTQSEFDGEVKRLGTFNLSRDYFSEFVEDFDNPSDDEKEALYEYFVGEIENILDNI